MDQMKRILQLLFVISGYLVVLTVFAVTPPPVQATHGSPHPCGTVAAQAVAARVKDSTRLIAGVAIQGRKKDPPFTQCTWGGQTLSTSGSCTTGADGICGLQPEPVNCGADTGGAIWTFTGTKTDYTCYPAEKRVANGADNQVAIVECDERPQSRYRIRCSGNNAELYVLEGSGCSNCAYINETADGTRIVSNVSIPSTQTVPAGRSVTAYLNDNTLIDTVTCGSSPTPSPTYSVSGSMRQCTLEAFGWADAALSGSTTFSIDNTTHSTTGSSYTFSGLVGGGYTLRAGSISDYTGPFSSCSSQEATNTFSFTVGPSHVQNLYYKQITTSPPAGCATPTCLNSAGSYQSVGTTQACGCNNTGTQTCEQNGCTASWSTCSASATCLTTGAFGCSVGNPFNVTTSSADVTVTTSGDGTGWNRINWYLNNNFVDTTVGTPGTINSRTFSGLANSTDYTVKAQFYKDADPTQNTICANQPSFRTGQPSVTSPGPLSCILCESDTWNAEGTWWLGESCRSGSDQICSQYPSRCDQYPLQQRTITANQNTASPQKGQSCYRNGGGGITVTESPGSVTVTMYERLPNGTVQKVPNYNWPHVRYWVYNTTGRLICAVNDGQYCISGVTSTDTLHSSSDNAMGQVSLESSLTRDAVQLVSWSPDYKPVGFYNYQETYTSSSDTCYSCNDTDISGGRCATYGPCVACPPGSGTTNCLNSGACVGEACNRKYKCRSRGRSGYNALPNLTNGTVNDNGSMYFCVPDDDGNAQFDLIFERVTPVCKPGTWIATRSGPTTYSDISLEFDPKSTVIGQAFYAIRRDTTGYTDWIPATYASNRAHTGQVDFGNFGTPVDWTVKFRIIWSGGELITDTTCPFPNQASSWFEGRGADIHASSEIRNPQIAPGGYMLSGTGAADIPLNGMGTTRSFVGPTGRVRYAGGANNTYALTYPSVSFPAVDYGALTAQATSWDGSGSISHPGIVSHTPVGGTLTLTTAPTLTSTSNGITVLVINGNVRVTGNVAGPSPPSGVVYLVRGDITFAGTVTQAQGVYIADTTPTGSGGTITVEYGANQRFTVDGMLYARNNVRFNRVLTTASASELALYKAFYVLQPSFYTGLTRPTVSWQEVAPPGTGYASEYAGQYSSEYPGEFYSTEYGSESFYSTEYGTEYFGQGETGF